MVVSLSLAEVVVGVSEDVDVRRVLRASKSVTFAREAPSGSAKFRLWGHS